MLLVGGVKNTGRKEVFGSTRREVMDDIGPDFRRTLSEHLRDCRAMIVVGRFGAVAVDGDNFAIYVQNDFQRDTALDA